jgi:hypothetical protein
MKPLALVLAAVLSGVLATAARGSALPTAVGSTFCTSDNPVTSISDPSACQLGGGLASASVVTAPSVDLVSHAGSGAGVASFDAIGSLTYDFEVVGGTAGDHVPLLVATTLEATADPHTFAAAEIVITAPLLPIAQVRVCTDGSCASDGSFSSTLSVETVSGRSERCSLSFKRKTRSCLVERPTHPQTLLSLSIPAFPVPATIGSWSVTALGT